MVVVAEATWGIGGPTFLAGYVAGVGVLFAAACWLRRRLRSAAEPVDPAASRRLATRPIAVAVLHGGLTLAVLAACSALHGAGAVQCVDGRKLRRTPTSLPPDTPSLARRVYEVAGEPVSLQRLACDTVIVGAVRDVRRRLVDDGLLWSRSRRLGYRSTVLLPLSAILLGIVCCLAGAGRPVILLVLILITAVNTGILLFRRPPLRTRAGADILDALQYQHDTLQPGAHPRWQGSGPAAAWGVALFGTAAVAASAPTLADHLNLSIITPVPRLPRPVRKGVPLVRETDMRRTGYNPVGWPPG